MTDIISLFPAYKGRYSTAKQGAKTTDIISQLLKEFPEAQKAVRKFAVKMDGGTAEKTARNIWTFIRTHIPYKKDDDGRQIIQLPQAIVRNGGDCKSMSLLTGATLAELGYPVTFRFVSFNKNATPTHVYTVTYDDAGNEIPADSVIDTFNEEKPYTFKKDIKMQVASLSGIGFTGAMFDTQELQKIATSERYSGTICQKLARRKLAELSGQKLISVSMNDAQRMRYIQRLQRHIEADTRGGSLCHSLKMEELERVRGGNVSISGIEGFNLKRKLKGLSINNLKKDVKQLSLKNVSRAFKKVALSANRNAFLGLLKLNIFAMASRLAQHDRKKVEELWKKLGGNPAKLHAALTIGVRQKPVFGKRRGGSNVGIHGIGTDPATATATTGTAALAAPIIAAFTALLGVLVAYKKHPKTGKPILDANGQPIPDVEATEEGKSGFEKALDFAKDAGGVVEDILHIGKDGTPELKEGVEVDPKDDESKNKGGGLLLKAGAVVAAIIVGKSLLSHK